MVVAQRSFSADPFAVPLGMLMCFLFVIVAPVSWRVLFPTGLDLRHGGIRLSLYATIGAGVVFTIGVVVPRVLGMGRTLLTAPSSVGVCLALFLVGGWGLARDIWMEDRLFRSEARAASLAKEAERAQLLALRTHLDPHFLFNTLNAIAEWCREDGEVAERAVLQLAAMLRAVLDGVRAPLWSLREELALLDALFSLHQLRDPERLQFVRHLPDVLPDVQIPPMLLLPLAENALKHRDTTETRGEVTLRVSVESRDAHSSLSVAERHLLLTLENSGTFRGPRAGGLGLDMVERRLALAYDGDARFRMLGVGGRTVAEIRLPMRLLDKQAAR